VRVNKPGIESSLANISITYCGQQLSAKEGESIAAAMVAGGHYSFRTTERGEKRGLFCGMGVCGECAVTVDGQTVQLACMTKVRAGMQVSLAPSPRPLPQVLLGGVPEEEIKADLLVVGAGPGGLSAALAAARHGVDVLVTDDRPALGGQYFKQPAGHPRIDPAALDRQYLKGRELLEAVSQAGIRFLQGTRIWGARSPQELYGSSTQRRYVLRPRTLVLATGAFERVVPFPGWTLPGVMTTGAGQTLLRSYLVAPGRRVLIAGNGPLNIQLGAELVDAGVTVVAVAELAKLFRATGGLSALSMAVTEPRYLLEGVGYLRTLAAHRVPVLSQATVTKIDPRDGGLVASVTQIAPSGRAIPGTERRFEVDAVCIGFGFTPASELARSLGCRYRLDELSGTLVVEHDRFGRSSLEGVWILGDSGRIRGAHVAQAAGGLAGLDVARSLSRTGWRDTIRETLKGEARRRAAERFQRGLWRLYRAPRITDQLSLDETVVCRCEEVALGQLSVPPWLAAAGSIKRATRAGMGRCQGRYCSPLLVELAARSSGEAVTPRSGLLSQSPILPTSVGVLAEADNGARVLKRESRCDELFS